MHLPRQDEPSIKRGDSFKRNTPELRGRETSEPSTSSAPAADVIAWPEVESDSDESRIVEFSGCVFIIDFEQKKTRFLPIFKGLHRINAKVSCGVMRTTC